MKIPKNRALNKWLEGLSVSDLNGGKFTAEDVQEMLKRLKRNQVKYEHVIKETSIIKGYKYPRETIDEFVQEFLGYLPGEMTMTLQGKPLTVKVVSAPELEVPGDYLDGVARINADLVQDKGLLKKTIFHEMAHWVHDMNPLYARLLKIHFQERIQGYPGPGELPLRDGEGGMYDPEKIKGIRDQFADSNGNEYAGRTYGNKKKGYKLDGAEIPTTCLECLADPKLLLENLNHKSVTGRHSWRESFLVAASVLFYNKP